MPDKPTEYSRLAEFQAALLALLAQPLSPAEMLQCLHNEPAFAPYADYIATFEPRMIEVAAELTKKWGRSEE